MRTETCSAFRLSCLMVGSLLACGCGGPDMPKGDPTVSVTGTVTLDGQPLASGEIAFVEEDRQPRREYLAAIQDGKFESQAPPGKRRVEIRSYKTATNPALKDEFGGGPSTQIIPARYNDKSELTVELGESGELSFDLKSDKK